MKSIENMESIPGTFAFYDHNGDQIGYRAEFDDLTKSIEHAERLSKYTGEKVYVVRISRVVAAEVAP